MKSVCAIAGLLLLAAGCYWAWPPLGLIVSGVVLLGGAAWGHVRGDGDGESETEATEDGGRPE